MIIAATLNADEKNQFGSKQELSNWLNNSMSYR